MPGGTMLRGLPRGQPANQTNRFLPGMSRIPRSKAGGSFNRITTKFIVRLTYLSQGLWQMGLAGPAKVETIILFVNKPDLY